MRIVIDLEGIDVDPLTLHPRVTIEVPPQLFPTITAPPEVLIAAATLGAEDAGSAPIHLTASIAPTTQIMRTGRSALMADYGHSSAGPAPEVANPGTVVEELGNTAAGKAPRRTAQRSVSPARPNRKATKKRSTQR